MKVKDIKIGQPYFYEPGKWHSESLVIVLDTSTTLRTTTSRWDSRDAGPFVKHLKGYHRPSGTTTGYLALSVRGHAAKGLTQEQIGALGAVTANQVALDKFQSPERLKELGINAEVTIVQPRFLLGEWNAMVNARQEYEQQVAEARRRESTESALRVERWEKVADALEEITGTSLYVSSYGEEKTKEIGLEDMEKLIELAERARSLENLIDTTGTG